MIHRSAELHLQHIATSGDPFELGSSRPLDFGHWAAHKLEQLSHHQLRHGEAVAVGIALDSTYSYLTGSLPHADWLRIVELFEAVRLPIWHPDMATPGGGGRPAVLAGLEEFREHLGGRLTVMLLERIGSGFEVHELDETVLLEASDLLRAPCGGRGSRMGVHTGTSPLTQRELIAEYFMEHRVQVLELAAFLDRLDRAREVDADDDFRLRVDPRGAGRAGRRQRPRIAARADDLQRPAQRAAGGAGPEERQGRLRPGGLERMEYIDLHAHMVSRTTDDYRAMAMSGCVAVTEPAFWAGYDRPGVDAFIDYFNRLVDFEPKRAATYGIAHFTWMCLNPKEAEDRELTRQVLEVIPRYLELPNVLGIGEIGLNRVTRNELAGFKDHVDLAMEHEQLIHIHTPHLEDKWKGTKVIVETLAADQRIEPGRVMVDHAEEHTVDMILDNGFWTGLTLYPITKVSPARAVDVIEMRGPERICVAAACDWGESRPLAVPEFILEMRRRGHPDSLIRRVVYENPIEFLGQSPKFRLPDREGAVVA